MNLLFSLFGGMILTALLYGIGRVFKLSNFWAAILACAIPLALYVLYAAMHAPGLDVITIHLVAYPTVAVLFFQLYHAKADHAKTLHWAPKLMIGFFLSLSLLFGTLIYVSSQGLPIGVAQLFLPNAQGKAVHTGFAGVVAHNQEDAAKSVGQHLSNMHKLNQLGWSVEIDGLNRLVPGKTGLVTVRLLKPDGQGVEGVNVNMALARPGAAPKGEVSFARSSSGTYQGILPLDQPGIWVAYTTLSGHGESVHLEHNFEIR